MLPESFNEFVNMEVPNNSTNQPLSTKKDKADKTGQSIDDLTKELGMESSKNIGGKAMGFNKTVMNKLGMLNAMSFQPSALNQKMVMNARIYDVIFKLLGDMYAESNNPHAQIAIDLT